MQIATVPRKIAAYRLLQFLYIGIRSKLFYIHAVLRIRIRRIHMFLGLLDPDPDPLVRGIYSRIRLHTKMSWIRNTAFM
jgi:hypothetical protein